MDLHTVSEPRQSHRMEELYVLQLQGGKYYVGKTTDMNRRYEEHKSGRGSSWTFIHRPVKILEVRPVKDDHDENNTTKDLMKKYGVDNVRGGSYTQVTLPKDLESALQTELRGVSDTCFKCGCHGHFAKNCPESSEEEVVWGCNYCTKEFSTEKAAERHEQGCSQRPAKQRGYSRQATYNQRGDTCYRCGRSSHWADECYASRHVRGYEIDD